MIATPPIEVRSTSLVDTYCDKSRFKLNVHITDIQSSMSIPGCFGETHFWEKKLKV